MGRRLPGQEHRGSTADSADSALCPFARRQRGRLRDRGGGDHSGPTIGASLETQAKAPAEPKRSGPGAQLTEIVKTPQALATQVQGLSRGRFPALSATSRRSRCNTVSNSGRAVYGTQGSGKPVGPALEVLPAQDPGEGL